MNPPFGNEAKKWIAKLADHEDGIALLFARTDTKMFHEHVWSKASGVLFIEGRPKFCLPTGEEAKGNSGGPIVLIAYGSNNANVLRQSGLGKYLDVNQ